MRALQAVIVEPFRVEVREVELPSPAPNQILVQTEASAVSAGTELAVWTGTHQWLKDPNLPDWKFPFRPGYSAAGTVVAVGSDVRGWKPGDRVTVHCNYVDDQDPSSHNDSMLAANQRIWGFETNFGGLADLAVVKANQLMPKPDHLTWEEAAVNALCNSTSYRMLVGQHGARMKQGDTVLVWGATGGIGAYACQYVLNGGGIPVGVVSSADKVALLEELGVSRVIDRRAEGYRFWKDEHTQDPGEWRRLGKKIRELAGTDPDIVFEHPGRSTMGASVFVCKRGGMIITCAATSGYTIEYDNRYLWMMLKTLKGCHFANYREAWEANRLIAEGKIHPTLSVVYPLEETGEAAAQVHHNLHEGKIGVLCLAPKEGLGIDDPELRAKVGEDRITLFRRHGA